MPEEPQTPDLLELSRRAWAYSNDRDWEAALGLFAPEATFDMTPVGLGTYRGAAAIQAFFEDWRDAYVEFETCVDELFDLGNGVIFSEARQRGRLAGSASHVELRYGAVLQWEGGVIVRLTNYADIDEARAAAERLAAEIGPTRR
jgi:ketosteroid isomerase-like protein